MHKKPLILNLLLPILVTFGGETVPTQVTDSSQNNRSENMDMVHKEQMKHKIKSWIEEDRQKGTLNAAEAAIFLDVLDKNYPNYKLMKEDFETNILGSFFYAPWYEAAFKIGLIVGLLISLYAFLSITKSTYEKKNDSDTLIIQKILGKINVPTSLNQHSLLITSILYGLAASIIDSLISFCITFILVATFIWLNNQLGQKKDQPKYRFCTYLLKKGLPLHANYYNSRNMNFIYPPTLINVIIFKYILFSNLHQYPGSFPDSPV